jgi:hypothetical protein
MVKRGVWLGIFKYPKKQVCLKGDLMSSPIERVGSKIWPMWLLALVGVLAPVVVAGTIAVAGIRPPAPVGTARSQATQVEITRGPVGQSQLGPLLTAANATRDLLQFPIGAQQTSKHVHDAAKQEDYDEVDELDANGRPVSLTMFSDGRFKAAIRFDSAPRAATAISRTDGISSSQSAATRLGLVSGPPSLSYVDVSTNGWVVQWDRVDKGVPVRGDGTLVHVWADGRVGSVSSTSHALAPAPPTTIDATAAAAKVSVSLSMLVPGSVGGLQVKTPALEWVRPNGAFDSTRPIDSDPVGRLAWVVNVEASGRPDSGFTLLTVFVDAGDGSLLGGDVVE